MNASLTPTACKDYRPRTPENTSVLDFHSPVVYLEGSGSVSFYSSTLRMEFQNLLPEYWSPNMCEMAGPGWHVNADGSSNVKCAELPAPNLSSPSSERKPRGSEMGEEAGRT